jgi:hypothetical protein
MIRRVRFILVSMALSAAIAGTKLALATPGPQRPAQPAGTAATTAAMSRPGTGAIVPPPLDRLGVPLTVKECKGLGGVASASLVCGSGQKCVVAGQNGVIHSACISKD